MPDTDFTLLERQLRALIGDEPDPLANSANFVALLYTELPALNWAGIYVLRGSDLVLGPFQGRPACVRIPLGDGVCGAAAQSGKTMRIANVQAFDGHIACDPASRSELVVPLVANDRMVGVLDLDSPDTNRFSARDQAGVEQLSRVYVGQLGAAETTANFI